MRAVIVFTLATLQSPGYAALAHESLPSPSAEEVIQRALVRAEQMDRRKLETVYSFSWLSKTEKLDKEGNPREIETRRFTNVPYQGHSYARLVEIDGRPLDTEEQNQENERERKFREEVQEGNPLEESEERVRFDEELVGRYDFAMKGLETIGGRRAYALEFTPREGKLPVRRRMDRALNKSRGTIWIERETYGVAKLNFELMEKMGLWWGVIGSISAMRGSLEFQAVEEDAWMPSHFEFYINGRILFRSFHMNQTLSWSDFQKIVVPGDGTGAPKSTNSKVG